MIVSRIEGGLGNQMFQYAYGLFLARKHNVPLVLDITSYAAKPANGFLLDRFQIDAQFAGPQEWRQFPYKYLDSQFRNWHSWLGLAQGLHLVKEKPFGFHAKHLHAPNQSYVVGYWQSERYFPNLRDQLLKQFRPHVPLSDDTLRLCEYMRNENSIAIHVRRGDYLSNPVNVKLYRELGADYYRSCINDWAAHHRQARVYIFSNDMAWCKANLDLKLPATFVEHTTGQTAYEDLWMISQAACCVIANSTFSWWGAWLNQRPDKTIYAPRFWFHPHTLDDTHLNCDHWTTVPVDNKCVSNSSEKRVA